MALALGLWKGTYDFERSFGKARGVRLRRRKCYVRTNFLFYESSLYTFCSKFKIS